MSAEKKEVKESRLHPRNRNRERYDLKALITANAVLAQFVKPNRYGDDTVDFSDPAAVRTLNTALLNHYYGIENWVFPEENLCPPIPGRADYIHHMADLLCENNFGNIPTGDKVTCLDVGVGANCIYPIIGVTEYGWNFIGSDIDPVSVASASNIVASNTSLKDKITCKLQEKADAYFKGIIGTTDKIDISICNPPFHASAEDAVKGTQRKVKNLTGKKEKNPPLNFAGASNELICEGGELTFIHAMINESKEFASQCYWFSTLVSKQSNLKGINKLLDAVKATKVKTIPMGTGNKSSRIVAWTFLTKEEQKEWKLTRWNKKPKKEKLD